MNRNLVKILVGMLMVSMLLSGCSQGPAPATGASGKQKIVTMAMTAPWDTFVPFNTTNGNTDAVLELIYDKLTVLNTDGTVKPRLAKSWSIDEATHTKITFVLNEKAKWHDGAPVTADDVVFTAELMANPDISVARRSKIAPFTGTKGGVRDPGKEFGVKALDKQTVQFTMIEPTGLDYMLFIMFRDFYVLPKHLLKDIPVKSLLSDKFWQRPIGSGPCKFESEISGERVQLTANKDYHLGAPDFDRFVVRIVPESNILSGLINGEIDVVAGASIGNIPLNDWDMAKKQEKLVTKSVPSLGYQYMSINTKRIPQPVRQAINMAINRDALVNNLMKGEGLSAPGPLRPDHKYFNKALLPIPYDVEKAKAMVAGSGFDTSKEYELRVSKGNSLREKSAPMLQQDLAKIGIKVKIVTTDHPTMLTAARKGDYDFALIGSWGSPDPGESVLNVTPGHINNFSQLQDRSLANLGDKGLKAFTFETRKPFYEQYQMLLREQVPFTWLYFSNDLVAYNKQISNIDYTNFTLHNRSVWEWKVAK